MTWRRTGDKPLSETMLTRFPWRKYAALGGRWVNVMNSAEKTDWSICINRDLVKLGDYRDGV